MYLKINGQSKPYCIYKLLTKQRKKSKSFPNLRKMKTLTSVIMSTLHKNKYNRFNNHQSFLICHPSTCDYNNHKVFFSCVFSKNLHLILIKLFSPREENFVYFSWLALKTCWITTCSGPYCYVKLAKTHLFKAVTYSSLIYIFIFN